MRLVNSKYNLKIEFEENKSTELVDFNNKKIITKLYEQLSQIAKEENEGYDSINSEIVSTLEKICGCVEYSNVQYDLEFDWKNLFKLYNVRIGEDYKNIYEKLENI